MSAGCPRAWTRAASSRSRLEARQGRPVKIATFNVDSVVKRLDHLLLPPDLADRLVEAGVDRWTRGEANASDHAPAWIKLAD